MFDKISNFILPYINIQFLVVSLVLIFLRILYILGNTKTENLVYFFFLIYALTLILSYIFCIWLFITKFNEKPLKFWIKKIIGKNFTIFFLIFIGCPNKFLVNNNLQPYTKMGIVCCLNIWSYYSDYGEIILILYTIQLLILTLLATTYKEIPFITKFVDKNLFPGDEILKKETIFFFFQ